MVEKELNQEIRRILNRPGVHYTASGRYALEVAIGLLRLPKGTHALVPWYICESALQPFKKLQIPLLFYKIEPDFQVQLDDLKRHLDQGLPIGVVLFVNYFGFQQNGQQVVDLCREYNIPTIEDNTQSFLSFSRTSDQLLGTIGDIGIFSFRKTALVLGGAALSINRSDLQINPIQTQPRKPRIWLQLHKARLRIRLRFALVGQRYPLPPLTSKSLRETGTLHETMQGYELYRGGMNPLSRIVLKYFDFAHERQRRQEKFKAIQNDLAHRYGLQCLVSPDPLVRFCPYMFPFLSSNLLEHVNQLRRDGYIAQTWPGPLPQEVPDIFSPKTLFNRKELGVISLGYY